MLNEEAPVAVALAFTLIAPALTKVWPAPPGAVANCDTPSPLATARPVVAPSATALADTFTTPLAVFENTAVALVGPKAFCATPPTKPTAMAAGPVAEAVALAEIVPELVSVTSEPLANWLTA